MVLGSLERIAGLGAECRAGPLLLFVGRRHTLKLEAGGIAGAGETVTRWTTQISILVVQGESKFGERIFGLPGGHPRVLNS